MRKSDKSTYGLIAGGKSEGLRYASQQLRHEPTKAEHVLWRQMRSNSSLAKLRFRRQQVIDRFIVDFYCHQASLVVELDGGSHDGREEIDFDRQRIIEAYDIRVLRFRNEEVFHAIEDVLDRIITAAKARLDVVDVPQRE